MRPGTRYVYRVEARSAHGLSEASGDGNAETPQVPPPSRPTGLVFVSASHDSITLNWDAPTGAPIDSFQVLRRSRDGSEYGDGQGGVEFEVVVDDTGSSAATYTDTSAEARSRYVYRVKARNGHSLSGVSGDANAETHPDPADLPQYPLQASTPNVVIILADDLGWGDVRSNNPDSAMTTPRIDGIAASGVNYTDAHSPSSVCSPTRYGLLTGRHGWRTWKPLSVINGYDRPLIGPDRPTVGTLPAGLRIPHRGHRQMAPGDGLRPPVGRC